MGTMHSFIDYYDLFNMACTFLKFYLNFILFSCTTDIFLPFSSFCILLVMLMGLLSGRKINSLVWFAIFIGTRDSVSHFFYNVSNLVTSRHSMSLFK